MRVPISPHPCQHLSLSVLLTVIILMGVKWYLIVVLICISLMANDVKYPFSGLLAISISPWEKRLFRSFDHFKIGLSCLLLRCLLSFKDAQVSTILKKTNPWPSLDSCCSHCFPQNFLRGLSTCGFHPLSFQAITIWLLNSTLH